MEKENVKNKINELKNIKKIVLELKRNHRLTLRNIQQISKYKEYEKEILSFYTYFNMDELGTMNINNKYVNFDYLIIIDFFVDIITVNKKKGININLFDTMYLKEIRRVFN